MNDYIRGILFGFSIAAPVGPIGLLCIRRTLADGRLAGFFSGLGAATADAVYGSIAAFGLVLISNFLMQQQLLFRLVGGIFLIYLGMKALLTHPVKQVAQQNNKSLAGAYFSTFFLTLSNPLTILSFSAIFAGLGLSAQAGRFDQGAWLVAGVFSGSVLWWLILSLAAGWFRARLMGSGLLWINRLAGLLIISFGIFALLGLEKTAQTISSSAVIARPSLTQASTNGFAVADGLEPIVFPRDHGAHPDYQTEWWYYTGNLTGQDGSHFGYQLTFFRRALIPPADRQPRNSDWAADQAYLAHFAITDTKQGKHLAGERLQRGSAGLAGAAVEPFEVWLEDWQVIQTAEDTYHMIASVPTSEGQPEITLDLSLQDVKGPILQGESGYSRKGPEPGNASYYYSLTRLVTNGSLKIGNRNYLVSGISWMDHEYSTSALSVDQVGWDWFSIQLDNDHEIMLFQIRRADGTIDLFSSGAVIDPDSSIQFLARDDFNMEVVNTWTSPQTGAVYPARWKISIPGRQIMLDLEPMIADQELDLRYTYWEGAVRVRGVYGDTSVGGYGYVELTGYAGSMGGEF